MIRTNICSIRVLLLLLFTTMLYRHKKAPLARRGYWRALANAFTKALILTYHCEVFVICCTPCVIVASVMRCMHSRNWSVNLIQQCVKPVNHLVNDACRSGHSSGNRDRHSQSFRLDEAQPFAVPRLQLTLYACSDMPSIGFSRFF